MSIEISYLELRLFGNVVICENLLYVIMCGSWIKILKETIHKINSIKSS